MDGKLKPPDRRRALVFESLVADWAHQARSYARSVQLYHDLVARRRDAFPDALPAGTVMPIRRAARPTAPLALLTPLTGAVRHSLHDDTPDEPGPVARPRPVGEVQERRRARLGPLTRRQAEIAGLIADGLTNAEIARRLVLTQGTVGNHVAHILRRLGVRNRAHVAAWMTRQLTGRTG